MWINMSQFTLGYVKDKNEFVCVDSHVIIFLIIAEKMLTNINYMIDYGQLINNPQAAKIFDDMEKFVQDSKL